MKIAALAAMLSSTAAASQIRLHTFSGGNYRSASSYHQSLEFLAARLPQKASLAPSLFARNNVVISLINTNFFIYLFKTLIGRASSFHKLQVIMVKHRIIGDLFNFECEIKHSDLFILNY
jgi:hypothetical protein